MPFVTVRFARPLPALLGSVALAAAIVLAACSQKSQSLADYIAAICASHFRDATREEAPFLADNVSAMSKMMVDMGITPSGDIDRDFVAMMVPHHQGAIDMAQAELRYGQNEQLRRMAQEIIVTQQAEIAAMRLAVGQPLPSATPAPDQQPMTRSDDTKSAVQQPIRSCEMKSAFVLCFVLSTAIFMNVTPLLAGQAPGAATDPDIPVSHHDRVYAAEQFSNTVSVTDPADNKLLGVIRLGEPSPTNFSPLYRGQVLVHGMGFSPDRRTLAVVSIGSNSVTFIDTATNAVKHVTYVGRSPHEAFFTPDGKEVWVTVRGENYVSVLDGTTYEEKTRIITPNGPGMQIFSPDGKYGYVCSSFNPELDVITVADHAIIGKVTQASPFCPNIAATPDGAQVWFTLKDTGKTQVFDARPPFALLKTLDTGPITNHVNIVRNARGQFAYVTIGGSNQVKVFRTDDFSLVATIAVGKLPHGIWPSGDGSRVYVGLENDDKMTAIDTMTNTVIATSPIGQAPQAVVYVPNAVPVASEANNVAMTMMPGDFVPEATATKNLQPLGVAGQAAHFTMASAGGGAATGSPTSVTLFDQGLIQVLEAAVSGLEPGHPYVLALSDRADGGGKLEGLAGFMTNPAGAAVVNAIGPIRQVVQGDVKEQRRYLVIAPGTAAEPGAPVQIQQAQ